MAGETPAVRLSNPWIVLAMLLVIYIFNFADRYLLTGLVGPIKAEFGLGDGFMGLLMGPAFVVLYVVAGVPIARLADRSSRVRIIAAGCIVWSACTVLTGLATGPVWLGLARVGVGIGEAAFVAPAYSLLAAYFRPERRGLAFAIIALATYFGQIMGQAGGPIVAAEYGWRTAFFAIGAPGIPLAVLALLLIREPQRSASEQGTAQLPFRAMIRLLARASAYPLMMIGFGLGTLSGVAFAFWGPELFARAFAMNPVAVKSAFALNFGLSGLTGMMLFGGLADRLSRRNVIWPARLSAIALACATASVLAATWSDSFYLAMAFAVPAGLLGGGWSIGLLTMLQYMLPDGFRASATALFIAVTTLLGYFVGPWLAGEISGMLGNSAQALRLGLTIVIPTGFLAALLAMLASRRIEQSRAVLACGGLTT